MLMTSDFDFEYSFKAKGYVVFTTFVTPFFFYYFKFADKTKKNWQIKKCAVYEIIFQRQT